MNTDTFLSKKKILDNFLILCLYKKWNDETLKEAFLKAEIDIKFLPFIFKNGCLDVANFFSRKIDQEMIKRATDFSKKINFSQMKISDKIENLLKIRLKINYQYQIQIEKLIDFYLQPKNMALAFKNAYKTADLMWKIAGDNDTDFNFYSKRLILTKIYIRILLFFTKDKSTNYQKTIILLEDQIRRVIKLTSFKFKVKNQLEKVKNCFFEQENCFFKSKTSQLIKKLPFFRLYK